MTSTLLLKTKDHNDPSRFGPQACRGSYQKFYKYYFLKLFTSKT